jgi:CysZ protein
MFASAGKALHSLGSGGLFGVLLKSAGITILIFVIAFELALYGLQQFQLPALPWLGTLLLWLAPFLFILLFINLGAPVTALVASFFLDDIADAVESKDYPGDPKAHGIPFSASLWAGLRIAFLLVFVNIVLLPFHIVLPGVSGLITLLVDGWFLGRQYFELAAMRHLPRAEADTLRSRNASAIFGGGLMIAVLAAIPLLNLLAPFFGTALMVHAFKAFARAGRTERITSPSGVLNL